MEKLSDRQQAIFMLLTFILPVLITWTANGAPTDKTSLTLVASGILSGILAFIKEILGSAPSKANPAPSKVDTSTPPKVNPADAAEKWATSWKAKMFNKKGQPTQPTQPTENHIQPT